jgi:hypothetical protein
MCRNGGDIMVATVEEVTSRALRELLPDAGDERIEQAAHLIASHVDQLPLTTMVTRQEDELVAEVAAVLRADAGAVAQATS